MLHILTRTLQHTATNCNKLLQTASYRAPQHAALCRQQYDKQLTHIEKNNVTYIHAIRATQIDSQCRVQFVWSRQVRLYCFCFYSNGNPKVHTKYSRDNGCHRIDFSIFLLWLLFTLWQIQVETQSVADNISHRVSFRGPGPGERRPLSRRVRQKRSRCSGCDMNKLASISIVARPDTANSDPPRSRFASSWSRVRYGSSTIGFISPVREIQYGAVCCSALQSVVVRYRMQGKAPPSLVSWALWEISSMVQCSVLQCVAECRSSLQNAKYGSSTFGFMSPVREIQYGAI